MLCFSDDVVICLLIYLLCFPFFVICGIKIQELKLLLIVICFKVDVIIIGFTIDIII